MKTSKAGCFVLLVIALIFAVFGAVMYLLPAPTSPVVVSGTPTASKKGSSWGNIYMDFTLENVSDKDVTVTYLEVSVSTNNGTEDANTDEHLTIKAGESVRCDEYYFSSYNSPTGISKIIVKVNGKEYYAYGTDPGTKPVGFVLFFFAAVFVVLTAVSFVGVSKQNKRYAAIEREVDAQFAGKALFVVGQYGKKGNAGKAAAKTAVSAVGAAVFAGLFGFGTYKIYGANAMKEFVVADDRLLVGNPSKAGFNIYTMDFMGKESFVNSAITVRKKNVTLTNTVSGEYFVFNLASNRTVTPEQLVDTLNKLIAPVESMAQGEIAADNAQAPTTDSDPFDL